MNLTGLKDKIRQEFDNYRLSTLVGLPLAVLLMIVALGVAAALGIEDLIKASSLIVDFVVIPAFVARLVSASSYLGRLIDAWNREMRIQADKGYVLVTEEGKEAKPVVATGFSSGVKTDRIIANWERWLTTFGVILGIAVGAAAAIALGAALPLAPSLSMLAYPVYVAGFIGIMAGLFNRIGLIIDNRVWLSQGGKGNRNKTEIGLMLLSAALGLAFGLALVLTSSTSLAVIAGVTPFLAASVFPGWLGGAIFILITMSVFTSAADYLGKSVSYLRSFVDKEFSERLLAKQVMHEHRGSLVGVLLGIALGVGVTVALALTLMPLAGLSGAAVGSLIILTTTGVVGGLVARMARLVDRLVEPVAVESLSPAERSLSSVQAVPGGSPTRSLGRARGMSFFDPNNVEAIAASAFPVSTQTVGKAALKARAPA